MRTKYSERAKTLSHSEPHSHTDKCTTYLQKTPFSDISGCIQIVHKSPDDYTVSSTNNKCGLAPFKATPWASAYKEKDEAFSFPGYYYSLNGAALSDYVRKMPVLFNPAFGRAGEKLSPQSQLEPTPKRLGKNGMNISLLIVCPDVILT
ncbi:hypothetical protein TNIN_417471 [Trichonephila inaurata madagascariensis]|uniref:Uncharacterized protein n=1 Tax=Trichonephila inaurata madagascariensis TaxID=2747483 RepID=A0A8X6IUB6_9ARAC|nr:hypothetical protein TNIN_417471 [Trichonephila inaurata madagascariensis]